MKVIGIPLEFNATNVATYNIQGSNLNQMTEVIVKQICVSNDNASVPPIPVCLLNCDFITGDQSLCTFPLEAGVIFTSMLKLPIKLTASNPTGIRTFTLSFGPGTTYDWSQLNVSVIVMLGFK